MMKCVLTQQALGSTDDSPTPQLRSNADYCHQLLPLGPGLPQQSSCVTAFKPPGGNDTVTQNGRGTLASSQHLWFLQDANVLSEVFFSGDLPCGDRWFSCQGFPAGPVSDGLSGKAIAKELYDHPWASQDTQPQRTSWKGPKREARMGQHR